MGRNGRRMTIGGVRCRFPRGIACSATLKAMLWGLISQPMTWKVAVAECCCDYLVAVKLFLLLHRHRSRQHWAASPFGRAPIYIPQAFRSVHNANRSDEHT